MARSIQPPQLPNQLTTPEPSTRFMLRSSEPSMAIPFSISSDLLNAPFLRCRGRLVRGRWLGYEGSPATNFTGADHLAGMTVTGLADGSVITPFVMPANGEFTLGCACTKVTVGLGYTRKPRPLRSILATEQSKANFKKLISIDMKVKDALNLWAGSSFNRLVRIKDLVIGNVSSMLAGR